MRNEEKDGMKHVHLPSDFSLFRLFLKLSINGVGFLLNDLGLWGSKLWCLTTSSADWKRVKTWRRIDDVDTHLLNAKLFIGFHLNLSSLLPGFLRDECNLYIIANKCSNRSSRSKVTQHNLVSTSIPWMGNIERRHRLTILFISVCISLSSKAPDLDMIEVIGIELGIGMSMVRCWWVCSSRLMTTKSQDPWWLRGEEITSMQ